MPKHETPPLWAGELHLDVQNPVPAQQFDLTLLVSERGLVCILFGGQDELKPAQASRLQPVKGAPAFLAEALQQVESYLRGRRRRFDLPLDERGWPSFESRALKACLEIPYGQVRTYSELARQVGSPSAGRAIGSAMAHNPIPLVIPCHRVIGADGKLHGYAAPGGLAVKSWLLKLEGSFVA